VDSKFWSKDAYPTNDRLPVRSIGKRTPDHRLDTGVFLMVVLLLSLGLWAAIWKAVTSMSAAAVIAAV
jgi:hypothetical protein